MKRQQVNDDRVEKALELVSDRLARNLGRKGDGAFVSPHEILGALSEEMHELEEAVRSGRRIDFGDELLDIAAVAAFAVASLPYLEKETDR